MSSQVKEIVERLNASPFKMGLTLIRCAGGRRGRGRGEGGAAFAGCLASVLAVGICRLQAPPHLCPLCSLRPQLRWARTHPAAAGAQRRVCRNQRRGERLGRASGGAGQTAAVWQLLEGGVVLEERWCRSAVQRLAAPGHAQRAARGQLRRACRPHTCLRSAAVQFSGRQTRTTATNTVVAAKSPCSLPHPISPPSPPQYKATVREEDPEDTMYRMLEILRALKYKPPSDSQCVSGTPAGEQWRV